MTDQLQQDELTQLKVQADELGIKYSVNISATTLKQRIEDQLSGGTGTEAIAVAAVNPVTAMTLEATKLIRCQITPMERSKANYEGEIFSVANSALATIKRYIPFGVITHVESILLEVIQEKEMLVYYTERVNGRSVRKAKMAKAYGVTVLPQLSQQELDDLAKAQQARNSIE